MRGDARGHIGDALGERPTRSHNWSRSGRVPCEFLAVRSMGSRFHGHVSEEVTRSLLACHRCDENARRKRPALQPKVILRAPLAACLLQLHRSCIASSFFRGIAIRISRLYRSSRITPHSDKKAKQVRLAQVIAMRIDANIFLHKISRSGLFFAKMRLLIY